MNQHTQSIVRGLHPEKLSVLEISGAGWRNFGFKQYDAVQYPAFDICAQALPKQYDLILAEQVLEHVRQPQRAAVNVLKMLRAGGTFLMTLPFLIRYHPVPLDLWRWTGPGLKCFLEDAGFVDVQTFSWGNKDCVVANLDRWVDYDPKMHSLANDPNYPIVVWGTGRRSQQAAA
jgi:hypothetical protein